MEFFFLDDTRQNSPSRNGMGPLVAVGGVRILGTEVGALEKAIDSLCLQNYGFPPGEEFKWSPGRELWMRKNLVNPQRMEFFLEVLELIETAQGAVTVVIEDTNFARATDAETPEMDVTRMFLERASSQCRANPAEGLVITDRAGSRHTEEDKFLRGCLEILQSTTGYVRPDSIALNVVSTPSKFIRLIQAADLVTGCTVAAVGGEERYTPPIMGKLKTLFHRELGRVGGVGVKIHPDYKYGNLYHWVLGDRDFVRFNTGWPLPRDDYPYYLSPHEP